jgi:phosphatidylglycerol:prolipoprotein diacylglycerol transferase
MRSILFTIPLDGLVDLGPLGKVPVFGPGLMLALWSLVGIAYVTLTVRRLGWKNLSGISLLIWCVVAVAIFKAAELPIKALPVYGYGTMLFLGFLASSSLAAWRLRREAGDGEMAWDAAMWIFIFGIIGARLFYIVEYWSTSFAVDPQTGKARTAWEIAVAIVNLPDGGLVLYGGLILAPLAYYVYCRIRDINALAFADVAITSVFVGILFGRLGCLLNGCCFGDVCSLPWAITFPAESIPFKALVARGLLDSGAGRSLPVHPAQLYDALSGLLLAIVTWAYYPYARRTGEVVAVGWIAYPINRFMIEFLRADEQGIGYPSLTIAQWVSLALLATGVAFFASLKYWSRGRQPIEVAPGKTRVPEPIAATSQRFKPAV